jgi:hypothetical protein
MATVKLVETSRDWLGEPPDRDIAFRVIEQDWNDGYSGRTVRRVEVAA